MSIGFRRRSCVSGLALLTALTGCGSSSHGGNSGPPATLTDAEIATFRTAVTAIDSHVAAAEGANASAQFAASVDWIRAQPGVASAFVAGPCLTVKFSSGLSHTWWQEPTERETAFTPPAPAARQGRAFPSHANKALLVRSVSGDLNMMRQAKPSLDKVKAFYEANGAAVTVADQPVADVAMAKTFGQYGSVFYHGHGGLLDDGPAIGLGEIASDDKLKLYADDVKAGRLVVGTIKVCQKLDCLWAGGGQDRDVLVLTPAFIRRYYPAGSLPGTLMFNMTCFGMADNRLAQAFFDAGSLGYAGWTDETTLGAQSGYALASYLTDGGHLAAALDAAAAQGLASDSYLGPTSLLKVFPTTSTANLYTSQVEPAITITSPAAGQVLPANLIPLRGTVSAPSPVQWVTVNLNGFVFPLSLDSQGQFARDLQPQAGNNHLQVTASSAGGTNSSDVSFSVNGNPLPLWISLGWNTPGTNLDLHLTGKNRDADALETFADCWSGLTHCFGAVLSPEAHDGYGPETISMASQPAAGYYRVWVHYVGTGPDTTAQCWVVGPNTTVGASRTLSAGQWWEVGAVTYSDSAAETWTGRDLLRPDITLTP